MNKDKKTTEPRGNGAHLVAAGILLSRISGLARQWIFARYFGNSDAGDAFYSALKIPNFLQNLFGEGVLSASFIPVYAKHLSRGEDKEADQVARVIGSVLALVTSLLVVLGIILTPFMIDLIAPGFTGEKRDLTIQLVQIFFPGTGLLVMSAWCLGILNSHRKFFLSYAAPVIWNFAIIAALVVYGKSDTKSELAIHAAWGLVVGSALQFGVQLPTTLYFIKKFRLDFSIRLPSVQNIFRNFTPVVVSRGVVQVSAYIDNMLASYLPTGAVSALVYAQSLYMLPISLFGMAISAAELPAMSRAQGSPEEISAYLRGRIEGGQRQVSFFIIPSIMAFFVLGDVIVAALYQSGEFSSNNSLYVWKILIGSTVGLLATTVGRLYSSAFYSLQDTKTPLKVAFVRVILTTVLGYICGLKLPEWFDFDSSLGAVGLTASAGFAGWIEFLLLRRLLSKRIGFVQVPVSYIAKLWLGACVSVAFGYLLKTQVSIHQPMIRAAIVLLPTGITYIVITYLLKIEQAKRFIRFR